MNLKASLFLLAAVAIGGVALAKPPAPDEKKIKETCAAILEWAQHTQSEALARSDSKPDECRTDRECVVVPTMAARFGRSRECDKLGGVSVPSSVSQRAKKVSLTSEFSDKLKEFRALNCPPPAPIPGESSCLLAPQTNAVRAKCDKGRCQCKGTC